MLMRHAIILLATMVVCSSVSPAHAESPKPNIIFILADDLGYGDLGCYGQKLIQTPNLDRMAREGIRFTDVYAGSTVCAPSRCVLVTGKHTGHCRVRGNAGPEIQRLLPEDVTVAEVLHKAGYATALCGKWGLGDEGNEGQPNDQGFDHFFGYLNQLHAHNYYPAFLWRNKEKVTLRNEVKEEGRKYAGFQGGWATKRVDYAHDLIEDEALAWVRKQGEAKERKPFFLYLAVTIPHANNEGTRGTGDGQEVPDYGIYKNKDWSNQNKGQAAMITRMDEGVGRLLALLKELKLDEQTIVFFSSDNGPHNEGGHTPKLFNPSGPLRGMKRDLYEGGVRVPMIVRWPGKVPAGREDHTPWMFHDFLPTCAELAGVAQDELPEKLDGRSIIPLLMGKDAPRDLLDRHVYWEFYEGVFAQAVRKGPWKAVRKGYIGGKTELYDLTSDVGETKDLAAEHPEVVKVMERLMGESHVEDENWKKRLK